MERKIQQKDAQDYRKYKRVNVAFVVLYNVDSPLTVRMSIGGRDFDAEALDLSEAGMAVLTKYTKYAVPAFTIVNVKFAVFDDHPSARKERVKTMEVKGQVRTSLFLSDKKAYRMGINFIDITEGERKFIAEFVKNASFKAGK